MLPQMPQEEKGQQVQGQAELQTQLAEIEEEHAAEVIGTGHGHVILAEYEDRVAGGAQHG